ncbi:helix-turn-helix transcriptional regulator [Streptomyces sp. SID13666]|uniref:winged helix-turn-helix transcriptional regulator n=1 Tax=unclassified Streptomyces TaxID=2593676 RepID=UPI0013C0FD46|nr:MULTISPECIES: winged helix-turn-helix transcriptional regulator [unclassified Streptomyces]NEA56598.1 helix-turn-helix transcriptional regulator [Streptomyces sp. SID13666]NEA73042.1 helix-turn-helix transcriptional regulator [Streptomyces sp. SID13588]
MPSLVQSGTSPIGAVDAQRVEDALALIAPKWTTWVVQTLAQQSGPLRVRDVAARLPFVNGQLVGKRLAQMHADGLATRAGDRHGRRYQLSGFGTSLSPVHQALSEWSQAHLSLDEVAGAERVEDAVRHLHLRHSTTVIQVLNAGGPMRFVHIAEEAGLDNGFTRLRLNRLRRDGLVTRTGPRWGDPYVLTDAGKALGPVYAAVEHWNNPGAVPRPAATPVATAIRTHTGAPLGSDGIRTAAALRRSPAAPGDLFSHAPQPRVETAFTVRSTPSRGR